jgi:hypothetical protein
LKLEAAEWRKKQATAEIASNLVAATYELAVMSRALTSTRDLSFCSSSDDPEDEARIDTAPKELQFGLILKDVYSLFPGELKAGILSYSRFPLAAESMATTK